MQFNDLNYQTILKDEPAPVLLIFNASFCGPSAMLSPFLDELSEEFAEVWMVDVDVERCPNMTRNYQVKQTPTLILFKKGEPVGSRMGTSTYPELRDWLSKNLSK